MRLLPETVYHVLARNFILAGNTSLNLAIHLRWRILARNPERLENVLHYYQISSFLSIFRTVILLRFGQNSEKSVYVSERNISRFCIHCSSQDKQYINTRETYRSSRPGLLYTRVRVFSKSLISRHRSPFLSIGRS